MGVIKRPNAVPNRTRTRTASRERGTPQPNGNLYMIKTITKINNLMLKLNNVCPIPDRIKASLGKLILANKAFDAVTAFNGALRLSTKTCHKTVPNMTKAG